VLSLALGRHFRERDRAILLVDPGPLESGDLATALTRQEEQLHNLAMRIPLGLGGQPNLYQFII
jgi:hypothetical protein